MASRITPQAPQSDGPTFHERVTAFWDWFTPKAPGFSDALAARRTQVLATEVGSKVAELLPGMAWELGPGTRQGTTSFTLSGEGDSARQILAEAWRERAPEIAGWEFHASRQPRATLTLEHAGRTVDLGEMLVLAETDEDDEVIDVVLWHPAFESADDDERATLVFLGLDAVLGELGTAHWIGGIDIEEPDGETMPLRELGRHVAAVRERLGWVAPDPADTRALYQHPGAGGSHPRADVVIGQSAIMNVIERHADTRGDMTDPLGALGADLAYVSFDASVLPGGEQAAARGALEEAIDAVLRPARLGSTVGGAFGRERAYVDVLLLDGSRSAEAVAGAVRAAGIGGRPALEYFGREKRGLRTDI